MGYLGTRASLKNARAGVYSTLSVSGASWRIGFLHTLSCHWRHQQHAAFACKPGCEWKNTSSEVMAACVWCGPSVKQAHAAGIRLQLRCFNYDLLFCHATGEISPALITWTLLPFLSFLAWPADTLLIVVRHTVGKEWAFPASSARLTVDRRAVISHTVKLLPQQTVTSSWWA